MGEGQRILGVDQAWRKEVERSGRYTAPNTGLGNPILEAEMLVPR